ncbi:MAG: amidophosphoribosyltransferase [Clostridiales bacterium]|nr:amidophosphoribosyltransferase [Clostridiales bacterium]
MFTGTDKIHEECAVFGTSVRAAEAAGITYNALLALQHRGQEGCGIAASIDNTIHCIKDRGLVGEVFSGDVLNSLPASTAAIGHCRYSTTGVNSVCNVQPFVTEYLTGRIATAHNGNITNARDLRDGLKSFGAHFDATSDSEVMSTLIALYAVRENDVRAGVIKAANYLRGAFSVVVLCGDGRLIAFRDPDGFRPLCIGRNRLGVAVASESCALDSCGFTFERDIAPGEVVVIENGEVTSSEVVLKNKTPGNGFCIFEYVYFSRPDSVIDGLPVYDARFNMGLRLAAEHPVEADIVCGVPDSGLEAAAGFSAGSGIPLVQGFVKNRYIGRSFIYPSQMQRENAVRLKLNPLKSNLAGKRVVLVDDSIVRGTTCAKIVRTLKSAGAKEVHFRISSPPFKHTCHYGTDIDSENNLIANRLSVDGICREIGADSLGYISVEGLKAACGRCNLNFCVKCFAGGETLSNLKNDLE